MGAMTPEHWQKVQDVFNEALTRSPEERVAFLRESCSDSRLRKDVEALLAADARPPSILETALEHTHTLPPGDGVNLDDQKWPISSLGQHIGPYHILHELGRGGMGTVYLAKRTDLNNLVALKLVRGGFISPEIIQRFQRERRLLARLEHPNIARLLDAGMTKDGTPFFVMEYVEGEPLTTYCDRRKLTISERLVLFQHVCQAVHYAHQNLIIHRDLKPQNILVDANGRVKLLDFGIAKLIEEDDDLEGLTRTGMRLMTPEYAAPEQVCGEVVTTATDVYALGVVLYVLMTGQPPYQLRELNLLEKEQVICEQKPEKPSIAARRYAELQGEGAGLGDHDDPVRIRNADRLSRRLSGDVDVICLKALEKEPERRYASVEALLEDIGRHLGGLPVVARLPTLGYRLSKFVRRHRMGVATGLGIMVMLAVLGNVFALRLTQERDRAQVEASKAAQVSSFLMGLFEANDPLASLGEEVTARELLDRGMDRAEALSEEPEVQAQMLDIVGRVYMSLGQYEKAKPALERALQLRRTAYGEQHLDVASSLHTLGSLLEGLNIGPTRNYARAESLIVEALSIRRALLGAQHPEVAQSLYRLGNLAHAQGDYIKADSLYYVALGIQRTVLGDQHIDVAETLTHLGYSSRSQRDLAAADDYFRQALDIYREVLEPQSLIMAPLLIHLSIQERVRQNYEAAESLLREALAIYLKYVGEDHPHTTTTLNNLGHLLHLKGDLDQAEQVLRRSLSKIKKDEDPRHYAYILESIATVLVDKEEYATAETLLLESLALRRVAFGDDHGIVAHVRGKLVEVYQAWGKPEKAAMYTEDKAKTGNDES